MVDALPEPLHWVNATEVEVDGQRRAYFGGCDYFRLAWKPSVRRAAARTLARGPVNVAASRRTTGNLPDHLALEADLARFLEVPAVALTANGTLPGFHVAEALSGQVAAILIDAGSHACLFQAARMAGVPVIPYAAGDAADARRRVRRTRGSGPVAVFTDGLFALDGRVAPLVELQAALPSDTWFVVDDAHGFGVLGARGRGVMEGLPIDRTRVVQLGTLSKAAGAYGGFVAGPAGLVESIRSDGRLYAGSTPLAPPMAAAARTALAWLTGPASAAPRRRLVRRSTRIQGALVAAGRLDRIGPGAAFVVVPGDESDRRRLRRRLIARAIHPTFIQYPCDKACQGFFRFALSSAHSEAQCRRLEEALTG